MLHTTYLDIELLSPVALPKRSSSLDDSGSRLTLPGATLLGACAKSLHDHLFADDAFRIFQTDAVRFGDGAPVHQGRAMIPTPRSFHELKHGSNGELSNLVNDELRRELIFNHVQVEPFARPFISEDLKEAVSIDTTLTMRTSVHTGGRAAEGLLFTLNVLPAGLVFRSRVAALTQDDLDLVVGHLVGERFVGRAKGTELGRVRIKKVDNPPAPQPTLPSRTRISFLARSSLALRDPNTGMPTFRPTPSAFGLPDTWRFDPEASFVRTESYTPFHGKRNLPDLDRHLIERGSVLTFRGETPAGPDQVARVLDEGVGEHRNAGLGAVMLLSAALLEPSIAKPESWRSKDSLDGRQAPQAVQAPPTDDLFRWAEVSATTHLLDRWLFQWAFANAATTAKWKLPRAQWGELRRRAREARVLRTESAKFLDDIKRHLTTGMAKLEKNWGKRIGSATAADKLLDLLRSTEHPAAALEHLAELSARKAPQEDYDESR